MEIINQTPFLPAMIPGRVHYPGHSLTIIVKGTFDLALDSTARVAEEQLYPTGNIPYEEGDQDRGSIRYESDFALFKPRTDLLLVGTCHPPGGEPVRACRVTCRIGKISKTLAVMGDRYWRPSTAAASEPELFSSMELRYEHSFGGEGYPANPVGKGFPGAVGKSGADRVLLPNIEDPDFPVVSPESMPDPAGFGPLNHLWSERSSALGTYSEEWLRSRWPWFPADFRWDYYCAANRGLCVEGYLRGDEEIYAENLHEEHVRYSSRLPGVNVRCFCHTGSDVISDGSFSEVDMNMDTVWVDMDGEQLVLVWRGVVDIQDPYVEEFSHLYIASEPTGEAPGTAEQWRERFAEILSRGDEDMLPEEIEAIDFEAIDSAIDRELHSAEQELELAQQQLKEHLDKAGFESDRREGRDAEGDKAFEKLVWERYGVELPAVQQPVSREQLIQGLGESRSFEGVDFSGLDLSGLDLRDGSFNNAIFKEANLNNVHLDGASVENAQFDRADFTGASLKNVQAPGADFTEAKLNGADLSGACLNHAIFELSQLTHALLETADAEGCYFAGADLSGTSFKSCKLDGADFSGASMNNANFSGASLREAAMEEATGEKVQMTRCDLTELRAEACAFPGSDFRDAVANDSLWEGADLAEADFSYCDLIGADFSSARLEQTVLSYADVKDGKFVRADLTRSRCNSANFFQATFEAAVLVETDFSGSNLYGAEFYEARLERCLFRDANVKMTKLASRQE